LPAGGGGATAPGARGLLRRSLRLGQVGQRGLLLGGGSRRPCRGRLGGRDGGRGGRSGVAGERQHLGVERLVGPGRRRVRRGRQVPVVLVVRRVVELGPGPPGG